MNVHALPDRRLLDAEASLTMLVDRARSLRAFGPTLDFDAPVWNLTDIKVSRPSEATTHQLFFTRITKRETRSMEGRVAFKPAFGNLIKSLIALSEHARAKTPSRHRKLLQASRHLYETLENRGFDPTRLTSDDFASAAQSVTKTSPSNCYTIGAELEQIAKFVNKHSLAKAQLFFTNPFPRGYRSSRIDENSRKKRASKMPSEELIDAVIAMSDIVRNHGDDRDVLRASIVESLMCAPWRINEFLTLRADCVRREAAIDPKTGERIDTFGWAYAGSKGAYDNVKRVPSDMVEVAERAMNDILRITQDARDVALWMEQHQGRAYVAEPFRLADPDFQLTILEVADALGLKSDTGTTNWLRANKVPIQRHRNGRLWCSLRDVEAGVLRCQPKLPHNMPQQLSEYLLLVPEHYFRNDMASLPCIVSFVTAAQISFFLQTKKKYKSVFARLNILDANGEPYLVTSHAFRHYLNTIANDGELSQLDIARWSGRKRIEQNVDYDHTGGRPLKKRMREMLNTEAMRGPLPDAIKKLSPVDREDFVNARINTAHLTDIGACIQDWSLAPCPKHGSCAGCGDHLVIKGNPAHKARAGRLLAEHEAMLAQAKAEMDEGTYGASDWVKHNAKLVDGLKKTIAVHENAEIPDGTVVQI